MKKFAITLLACLAVTSFTHAATSALTESLLEYEAITTALGTNLDFETAIPSTEFIVDIQRITKRVNVLGTVKYEIVTRVLGENERCRRTHVYIATLNVAANPGIGPNIVTVVSILPAHSR